MSKETTTTSKSSTAVLDAPEKSSGRVARFELTFQRKELTKELQKLERIVSGPSTLPISQHLLISASAQDQTVTFTSTNLETAFVSVVPAEVTKNATFTAPAKELHKIIKSLPGDVVRISSGKKSRINVYGAGTIQFELSTLPAEDFPALPSPPAENDILIAVDLVKYAIKRVTFAIASTDYAVAMNSALMKIDGNRLMIIATDGHRLSYTNQQCEGRLAKGEINILVSKEVFPQLFEMIVGASPNESVSFHEFDNFGSFKFGQNTLIFRKLESTFPNFQKFVDLQNPIRALVETKILKQALEAVTVLATDRCSLVQMTFENNQLALQWEIETSKGSGNVEITYQGEPLTIGFNGIYFQDFVKSTDCENISIQMKDPHSAAVLKPANEPERHIYVVMPMRV